MDGWLRGTRYGVMNGMDDNKQQQQQLQQLPLFVRYDNEISLTSAVQVTTISFYMNQNKTKAAKF